MTLLSLLMLLIYIVISAATIINLRSRTLDIARYISGAAFLIMMITFSLSLTSPDLYIVLALSLCIVLPVEITAVKETQGHRADLFLIHAIKLNIDSVLHIILLTLKG